MKATPTGPVVGAAAVIQRSVKEYFLHVCSRSSVFNLPPLSKLSFIPQYMCIRVTSNRSSHVIGALIRSAFSQFLNIDR